MEFLVQLGFFILAAAAMAFAARFIKQPPLVAYILTGIIIGSLGFDISHEEAVLYAIAEIGIILMLFIAGLKTRLREFIASGKEIFFVGPLKDIIMVFIGSIIGIFLFKLGIIEGLYLGIGLMLSSTIIIFKTLTARKEIAAPHGKILVGVMLFQDLIAMSALAVFTSLAFGGNALAQIVLTLVKGASLFILLYALGKSMMRSLFDVIAESVEGVFILGLAWCFLGVLAASSMGFSVEIAAFLAGLAIAHLPFSFEIRDKLVGLQDFGLLLFFFTIGATMQGSWFWLSDWKFWLLIGIVMIITPLVTMFIGSFLGFDKKKTFLISLMPAQVSEFSIIVMVVGFELKQISQEIFSLIILVTVLTMILSSGLLNNLNGLYHRLEKYLGFLEWRRKSNKQILKEFSHHVIIFGFGGLGQEVARHFKSKKDIVVVEWEPKKVHLAEKAGCHIIFGDAGDRDIWEETSLAKADLLVSTIGENIDDDLRLGKWIRKYHSHMVSIAETQHPKEVKMLKKAGYDFVILEDEAEWHWLSEYLEKPDIKKRLKRKL